MDHKKYIWFNGTSNLVWYNCDNRYGEISVRNASNVSSGECIDGSQNIQITREVCENQVPRRYVTHGQ
jgi:hypothetical protein